MKAKTKLSIILIVIAIIVGLVWAIVDYTAVNPDPTSASATIEFLYDGAAKGLDPNGTTFDGSSIVTEQIVTSALQTLGWQDKYAVSEIMRSVAVQGYYPKDIVKTLMDYDSVLRAEDTKELVSKNYYPTKYNVVLYNYFDSRISKGDLTKLLDTLVSTYYNYFIKEYSKSYDFDLLATNLDVYGYDYVQQVEILMSKISLIKQYCDEAYELKPSFTSNGVSFQDISLKCQSIIDTYMNKIDVNITMNALTTDVEALINKYEYSIIKLNYSLNDQKATLEYISDLVDNYERDSTLYIPSGDTIIKVGSTSGETYDAMVARKVALESSIADINAKIFDYTNRLEEITSEEKSNTLNYTTLKLDLQTVSDQLNAVKEDFNTLAAAYNDKYIASGSVSTTKANYSTVNLLSIGFIVLAVECCGPFCAIAVIIILAINLVSVIKKSKKQNA